MASLDARPGAHRPRTGVGISRRLYYPGTTDISGAGTPRRGCGPAGEADITVVRQQFFPVIGAVHSSRDTPANFEILDSGGRETGLSARFDRQDGTVHAAVPNGTWTIEAHVYGNRWSGAARRSRSTALRPASRSPSAHSPYSVIIRRDFSDSAEFPPAGSGPGMNLS